MSAFSIRRVDRNRAQAVEMLGSKPKFWFSDGDRRLLFKADDRGTGEDWAEVVACRLCELIGLPHVEYQLAVECDGEQDIRPGVVCENMAPKPLTLVLGNELLLNLDPHYPSGERFRVRQHTVAAVCDAVARLEPPSANWMAGVGQAIASALDVFVGYVMLDAWIANQDRHHENWAALRGGNRLRLAPTFDHGAALARNLRDAEREERLTTKDRGRAVAAFAERGRSAFYGTAGSRPLELRQAFQAFAGCAPAAANAWKERLGRMTADEVAGILQEAPTERMSETCKRFTMELLLTNRRRLLD